MLKQFDLEDGCPCTKIYMKTIKVVWKAVAVILNCHFTASTTYHDSLDGFHIYFGTGTANLKIKLLQQSTSMQ